jgi:glycosyltransferase involved in cell wall biosynthesis
VYIKEFLQAGHIAAQALHAAATCRHLHGHFCHGVATITWFASQLSGIPFSFTAHAKDIYQAELNPGRLLERKLGAARFVATCTCANAEVLQGRHPRPCDVHAIYHGLDTDWFSPSPVPRPAEPVPVLLAVGRFVEKKGFDQLIEACARLQAGRHALSLRASSASAARPTKTSAAWCADLRAGRGLRRAERPRGPGRAARDLPRRARRCACPAR